MKLLRFDREVGKQLSVFDSNFVMSKILVHTGEVHIGCMYIRAGDRIGYHEATCSQLFLVVQGNGWVRANNEEKLVIESGQAAFWNKGEFHETIAATDMLTIVIEGEELNPENFMSSVYK